MCIDFCKCWLSSQCPITTWLIGAVHDNLEGAWDVQLVLLYALLSHNCVLDLLYCVDGFERVDQESDAEGRNTQGVKKLAG